MSVIKTWDAWINARTMKKWLMEEWCKYINARAMHDQCKNMFDAENLIAARLMKSGLI